MDGLADEIHVLSPWIIGNRKTTDAVLFSANFAEVPKSSHGGICRQKILPGPPGAKNVPTRLQAHDHSGA